MTSANTDDDVHALRHLVDELRAHIEMLEDENRRLLRQVRVLKENQQ